MYLKCLYKELLNSSKVAGIDVCIYSPTINGSKKRQFYPLEIARLLLRSKQTNEKAILHIHWVEFLYRAGYNRYIIPFSVPITLAFFSIYKSVTKNKIAVTVHNIVPHRVFWSKIEYTFFRKMLERYSDVLFVHSELQKKILMDYYSINQSKIQVLTHGFFKPLKIVPIDKKNSIKLQFGISPGDLVFCFIGSISEYKGVSVLLSAMQDLLKANNLDCHLRLIIAGKADRFYLTEIAKKYCKVLSSEHVIFINKRLSEFELENILCIADFGVCPYISATTPATLLDFMRYNLPIITTQDKNVLQMLGDYPKVFLAKKGDSNSLLNAINSAILSSKNNNQQVSCLRILALENAWKTSANLTLTSYFSIIRS